jgi:hypothetical protein
MAGVGTLRATAGAWMLRAATRVGEAAGLGAMRAAARVGAAAGLGAARVAAGWARRGRRPAGHGEGGGRLGAARAAAGLGTVNLDFFLTRTLDLDVEKLYIPKDQTNERLVYVKVKIQRTQIACARIGPKCAATTKFTVCSR